MIRQIAVRRAKALGASFLLAALAAPLAVSQVLPLYDDDAILSVARPIILGEEAFKRRIAETADGGDPFGLVLSGGSARAFAHIGVLEALDEEGIRPDFLVADSMGAIVALLYGAGLAPADIAALFDAFPASGLFDPELPFSGGFLDGGRFIAMVRALAGDLDLADLPIPVLVACEDLISRRQVLIAEGDFATVMAASFALPAVFEPVRLGDLLLIDGGVTSLVPVEAAYRYSGRIAVATALYGREMDFSSPFVVINRALDLGKTRSSIEGLLEHRPLVIRCDVEELSYMQFSQPSEVAARGKASAIAALGELRAIAPEPREAAAGLAERRAYYGRRIKRMAAAARLGAAFPARPDILFGADIRVLDEARGGSAAFAGRRWAGPSVELRGGPVRAAFSALAGLEQDSERAWGLGLKLGLEGYAFPMNESRDSGLAWCLGTRALLSGSGILDGGPSVPEPREAAAEASSSLSFEILNGLILSPAIRAGLSTPIDSGELPWTASGGIGLETPRRAPAVLGLDASFEIDSEGNKGPSLSLDLGIEAGGVIALRARGQYRLALEGPGLAHNRADPYRSAVIEGLAETRFLASAEAVWLAKPLEIAFGELVIVERPEIGAYADFSGVLPSDGGPAATRLTIGGMLSAGFSIMGLAPMAVSAFAGAATDGSGWVLGLRAGRFFE